MLNPEDEDNIYNRDNEAIKIVMNNFCLDLTDEEAAFHFQTLINESVSALFPQVIETIHKWAQYWRK